MRIPGKGGSSENVVGEGDVIERQRHRRAYFMKSLVGAARNVS